MIKRLLPASTALLATLAAAAAHAQSSYVMTTLSAPASSTAFAATAMDNNGRVGGFSYLRDGTIYAAPGDFGTAISCFFGCAAYSFRTALWPAGTASSAAPTTSLSSLIPATMNTSGTIFGYSGTYRWPKVSITVPVTPSSPLVYSVMSGRTVEPSFVQLVGTNWVKGNFKAYGINQNDEIFGTVPAQNGTFLPAVSKNNQTTTVPLPAPYVTGRYTAMNGVGGAVGKAAVSQFEGPAENVLWQGANVVPINLPSSYDAVTMNNAGQVLMQEPESYGGSAAVWFNGTATPINGNGKRVFATAMNSSGTVVGCTQTVTSGTPRRSDNTAFIWNNGVMQDLAQVLTSKGVRLPTGTRLGCPMAINDSGSILAYYYRTASVNTITWVRFTARP